MNEEKKEAIFADGMYFEKPREGAPEFVKGKLSINVDRAIPFLQTHKNSKGYVNVDLKVSREGKLYLQLNTWEPKVEKPGSVDAASLVNEPSDNIPFN